MQPGEKVEVEASDTHDGVVRIALVWNHEIGYGIPDKHEVLVVRGTNGPKEGRTCREEGDILDIRVMLLGCCQRECEG